MPPPLQTALPNPLQTRLVKILWERGGPAPQRCHVHAMAWLWTCFQQKLAELHFLSFSHSSYSTHFQKDMRPLSSDARSKQRSFHVSTLPAWLLCGIASDFLSCDRTDSDSPHLGWGVGVKSGLCPAVGEIWAEMTLHSLWGRSYQLSSSFLCQPLWTGSGPCGPHRLMLTRAHYLTSLSVHFVAF